MENLLPAAIITVLIVLGAATVLALANLLRDTRFTFLSSLLFASAVVLVAVAVLRFWPEGQRVRRDFLPPDFLLWCSGVLAIALAAVALWILVKVLTAIPDAKSSIRRGVIQVWPQLILRRKTTKAIVDHARAITQMNLPLAEGFFLAGQQTPGRTGVVMRGMASFLQQGLKLSEAYARYKARSSLVLSILQVGERCGQLPSVLQYLQEHFNRQIKQRRQWTPVWRPYAIFLLLAVLLVVTFVMVTVMPKFETIFREYGIRLPSVTRAAVQAARLGAIYWVVWIGLAALVAVIVILLIRPRRCPQPRLYSRLADRLVWMIPPWRANREYTDLAHTAAVLGLSLGSGMTLSEAIKCAADLDINTVLRRRFERLHEMLVRGETPEQAGRKVDLPRRFLWALRSGQDRETLQASLGLIERYYSLVASHWFLAINTLIWPVIVVAMGCLVGFCALAFFLPLVKVIEATAAW